MIVARGATTEERAASAAGRWIAAVALQTRGRQMVDASRWRVHLSRARLDRPRSSIQGGIDVPFPINGPVIRARLRALIDAGAIPAVVPPRIFMGPCVEAHECTACGVDVHRGEQEHEWIDPRNQVLYFHRRCVDIYRTLEDRSADSRGVTRSSDDRHESRSR